jgi:hypothetical protein
LYKAVSIAGVRWGIKEPGNFYVAFKPINFFLILRAAGRNANVHKEKRKNRDSVLDLGELPMLKQVT